jgi:hypothetical protein
MAFVAPVLAAVGGGSAVAGGITLATAAAGIYSSVQQAQAGAAQKAQYKEAAAREADSARQDEIERRRELMRGLAVRNATAAAGGITTAGSVGTLTRTDIKDNRNDLLVSSLNSSTRQRALRGQGRAAATQGNTSAAVSLLDTASDLYKAVPRKAA